MKLIVGLGNPGNIYAGTRHNIGFSVIRALTKSYKISFKKENNGASLSAKGKIEGRNIIFAMPLKFMNSSGIAVASLLKKYKIDLDNLLVVLDDLDLEFGRLRIRAGGSSGGHRGLKSIIESLDSQKFARLRIGVSRPAREMNSAEYVLSPFAGKEKGQVGQVIENAMHCCASWATKGIAETMNTFNTRSKYNA